MAATLTTHLRDSRSLRTVRPEIQALRALAVGMVVIYHLYPQRLTGGFIGVDVFFVISGFLITSHLVRGLTSTPRLRLRTFYLARARRLLPASLLVLLVVAILTFTIIPQTSWGSIGAQLISSSFYVQNWTLAAVSVDYLAAGTSASPIQHFWSLSVEEQFYAVWPLLLLALILTVKGNSSKAKLILLTGVGAVTLASFVFSIWATSSSPADAYFVTPTRVWEFGAGAILGIVANEPHGRQRFRGALSWLGLVGIGLSGLLYTGSTPFPGYTALLPVVATAAVIFAGAPSVKWAPTKIFLLHPVQFLGNISYSVYLWHWPIIVLWPLFTGNQGSRRSVAESFLIILISIALGWVTKTFIEDRFRAGKTSTRAKTQRSDYHTLIGIVAAMVIVSIMGGASMSISQTRIDTAKAQLESFNARPPQCFGADIFVSSNTPECISIKNNGTIYPDPIIAAKDVSRYECQQSSTRSVVTTCTVGVNNPEALKVALVGDSHAGQWLPAVEDLANNRGWSVTTYLKSGCAFTSAVSAQKSCQEWNGAVSEAVTEEKYDLLITSSVAEAKYVLTPGMTMFESAVDGLKRTWAATKTPIVALSDIPRPASAGMTDSPACVDTKPYTECSFSQSGALAADPQKNAAAGLPNVHYLDMTKYFCSNGTCPSVAGNVLIYRDSNHMTATFSRSLAKYLELEMQEILH